MFPRLLFIGFEHVISLRIVIDELDVEYAFLIL